MGLIMPSDHGNCQLLLGDLFPTNPTTAEPGRGRLEKPTISFPWKSLPSQDPDSDGAWEYAWCPRLWNRRGRAKDDVQTAGTKSQVVSLPNSFTWGNFSEPYVDRENCVSPLGLQHRVKCTASAAHATPTPPILPPRPAKQLHASAGVPQTSSKPLKLLPTTSFLFTFLSIPRGQDDRATNKWAGRLFPRSPYFCCLTTYGLEHKRGAPGSPPPCLGPCQSDNFQEPAETCWWETSQMSLLTKEGRKQKTLFVFLT